MVDRELMDALHARFCAMDADGSGSLTRDDLCEASIEPLGAPPPSVEEQENIQQQQGGGEEEKEGDPDGGVGAGVSPAGVVAPINDFSYRRNFVREADVRRKKLEWRNLLRDHQATHHEALQHAKHSTLALLEANSERANGNESGASGFFEQPSSALRQRMQEEDQTREDANAELIRDLEQCIEAKRSGSGKSSRGGNGRTGEVVVNGGTPKSAAPKSAAPPAAAPVIEDVRIFLSFHDPEGTAAARTLYSRLRVSSVGSSSASFPGSSSSTSAFFASPTSSSSSYHSTTRVGMTTSFLSDRATHGRDRIEREAQAATLAVVFLTPSYGRAPRSDVIGRRTAATPTTRTATAGAVAEPTSPLHQPPRNDFVDSFQERELLLAQRVPLFLVVMAGAAPTGGSIDEATFCVW